MSIGHHSSTAAVILAAWNRWRPTSLRVAEGVHDALRAAIPGLLRSGHDRLQCSHALAALTLLDGPSLSSPRSAALGLDRAAYRMQRSKRYRLRYQAALALHQATSEWPRTAPSGLVPASPMTPRSATPSRKA